MPHTFSISLTIFLDDMLPESAPPPRLTQRRTRKQYLEVEDGVTSEAIATEWADCFQNCICILTPWTVVTAAFDQRKYKGRHEALDPSHDETERESLLSNISKRRRFRQVRPVQKELTYNMSVQTIESEPPFHVSLTPRYYGMCPLGYQEIIYFK